MNHDLATHISLLAAPLYAAMLGRALMENGNISPAILSALRENAITQAHALWLDTLERDA